MGCAGSKPPVAPPLPTQRADNQDEVWLQKRQQTAERRESRRNGARGATPTQQDAQASSPAVVTPPGPPGGLSSLRANSASSISSSGSDSSVASDWDRYSWRGEQAARPAAPSVPPSPGLIVSRETLGALSITSSIGSQLRLRQDSLFGLSAPPLAAPVRDSGRLRLCKVSGCTFVNQYMVIKYLGRGSSGRVFLCMSLDDFRLYAVKIVRKDQAGQGKAARSGQARASRRDPLEDLRREIEVMRRALHPNIVALREVVDDSSSNKMLLVMDYMEGGPVMTREGLEKGHRVPEDVARLYFRDMCKALDYLHCAQRVVHGDLKPENALMGAAGGVALSDFGCSKVLADADAEFDRCNGTPAFLAPEMMKPNARYRGRPADVYALGGCLYSFVYGRIPFKAPTVMQLFELVQTAPLAFPEQPHTSQQLRQLLRGMLEKDPRKRLTLAQVMAHPWMTAGGALPPLRSCQLQPLTQLAGLDTRVAPVLSPASAGYVGSRPSSDSQQPWEAQQRQLEQRYAAVEQLYNEQYDDSRQQYSQDERDREQQEALLAASLQGLVAGGGLEVRAFAAGEPLMTRGQQGAYLMYILEGECEVLYQTAPPAAPPAAPAAAAAAASEAAHLPAAAAAAPQAAAAQVATVGAAAAAGTADGCRGEQVAGAGQQQAQQAWQAQQALEQVEGPPSRQQSVEQPVQQWVQQDGSVGGKSDDSVGIGSAAAVAAAAAAPQTSTARRSAASLFNAASFDGGSRAGSLSRSLSQAGDGLSSGLEGLTAAQQLQQRGGAVEALGSRRGSSYIAEVAAVAAAQQGLRLVAAGPTNDPAVAAAAAAATAAARHLGPFLGTGASPAAAAPLPAPSASAPQPAAASHPDASPKFSSTAGSGQVQLAAAALGSPASTPKWHRAATSQALVSSPATSPKSLKSRGSVDSWSSAAAWQAQRPKSAPAWVKVGGTWVKRPSSQAGDSSSPATPTAGSSAVVLPPRPHSAPERQQTAAPPKQQQQEQQVELHSAPQQPGAASCPAGQQQQTAPSTEPQQQQDQQQQASTPALSLPVQQHAVPGPPSKQQQEAQQEPQIRSYPLQWRQRRQRSRRSSSDGAAAGLPPQQQASSRGDVDGQAPGQQQQQQQQQPWSKRGSFDFVPQLVISIPATSDTGTAYFSLASSPGAEAPGGATEFTGGFATPDRGLVTPERGSPRSQAAASAAAAAAAAGARPEGSVGAVQAAGAANAAMPSPGPFGLQRHIDFDAEGAAAHLYSPSPAGASSAAAAAGRCEAAGSAEPSPTVLGQQQQAALPDAVQQQQAQEGHQGQGARQQAANAQQQQQQQQGQQQRDGIEPEVVGEELPPSLLEAVTGAKELLAGLRRGPRLYLAARRGPGDFVGEMEVLGGSQSRRVATVVAASAVHATLIPYQAAKAYLSQHPLAKQQLAQLMWLRQSENIVLEALARLAALGDEMLTLLQK